MVPIFVPHKAWLTWRVSKSQSFVQGSWNWTCEHIFSILPRAVYTLVNLVTSLSCSFEGEHWTIKDHTKVSVCVCIFHYLFTISKGRCRLPNPLWCGIKHHDLGFVKVHRYTAIKSESNVSKCLCIPSGESDISTISSAYSSSGIHVSASCAPLSSPFSI